jgi:hypothetical protein
LYFTKTVLHENAISNWATDRTPIDVQSAPLHPTTSALQITATIVPSEGQGDAQKRKRASVPEFTRAGTEAA